MPEGDTIWRAARALDLALAGQVVRGFRTTSPDISPAGERSIPGRTVGGVRAIGKHLLMTFSRDRDDVVLHTHMRMNGSWHLYRPGERWRRSPASARVVVETDAYVAPCFDAPVVELVRGADLERHAALRGLGPDAMTDTFDLDAALVRVRSQPDREIGVALLDQRAVSGIGNVLKSESLFLAAVSPFAPVSQLDGAVLRTVLEQGHRLLVLNRTGPSRRTRFVLDARQKLWVYGRRGKPCHVCGTAIGSATQGEEARRTYWCPTCQAFEGSRHVAGGERASRLL